MGSHAFPFHLEFPAHSPTSVTLQPGPEEAGEPCGVEYYVRGVVEAGEPRPNTTVRWLAAIISSNVAKTTLISLN